MNVNMPIKIHNRFDIEVKDVTTGEIVQKGEAENIILNNFFTSTSYLAESYYIGNAICFGSGTGTMDPTRTTLFSFLGQKTVTTSELVLNTPPTPSYRTIKIVLAPEEFVGNTITEVGLSVKSGMNSTDIYTHALIKDSEGNLLSIEKTDTQEITIYATIYATLNLEPGLVAAQRLLRNLTCGSGLYFRGVELYLLGDGSKGPRFTHKSPGCLETTGRVGTSSSNGKIKTGTLYIGDYYSDKMLDINFETLAQNNSSMWSGYQFQQKEIGIGDGEKTTFDLPWDEAVLDKGHKIYLDGVEQTSGYTFTESQVIFDVAPSQDVAITGDWFVYYIPKDDNHVLDFQFTLSYAEGVPN